MSSKEAIENKQRIIFYGEDAKEHMELASQVLHRMKKEHDILFENQTDALSDAPLVLIENQTEDLWHHILVVGKITDTSMLNQLADATPKAGSIVFDTKQKKINEICSKERVDVVQVPYVGDKGFSGYSPNQIAAVGSLLKRIRITEDQYNEVLQSL